MQGGRSLERRSALLAGDYRGQLAALDYMYHGTAVWEVGPLVGRVWVWAAPRSGHWCIPGGQQGVVCQY